MTFKANTLPVAISHFYMLRKADVFQPSQLSLVVSVRSAHIKCVCQRSVDKSDYLINVNDCHSDRLKYCLCLFHLNMCYEFVLSKLHSVYKLICILFYTVIFCYKFK